MQSFIITHTSKKKRDAYITSYLDTHTVSSFDRVHVTGEVSLGIEDIRLMQKQLFLMPVKGKEKAIILDDAHTLTIEAQNALLKVLEEPPLHALFFLSTATVDQFLPTILSRCTVIQLTQDEILLSPEDIFQYTSILENIQSDRIGERLYIAEKLAAEKETLKDTLAKLIILLRQRMLADIEHNHIVSSARLLKELQACFRIITTTNTSPRLTLEHYFLLC